MFAPAKTPKAIVDRVNASVVKALADPAVRNGLSSQGAEPVGNTPEEYDRYNRSEIERWTKVARAAGVVAEMLEDEQRASKEYNRAIQIDPEHEGVIRALHDLDSSAHVARLIELSAQAQGAKGAVLSLEAALAPAHLR